MIHTSHIRVRNIIERTSNDLVGTSNNIFLVGFMASGKSHVGRQLAKRTGWNLLDADSVIIERAGKSIEEIFNTEGDNGKNYFPLKTPDNLKKYAGRLEQNVHFMVKCH